ncbi:hypothetical protein DWF00_04460 [Bosea caraganae]|uniref:DUF2735 domain-containing protein n=1 Tax=Bosea caraganae TaxID=2763117 RepID=A0A370KZJ8_9HYPH|nr:hypothetical protein [Bosea caraganae]RDJ20424.1 hypothetical protein DWE98_24170 [Bosea caraganae]RDJ29940.1 hypothetical protein DWF00_04460 [Bosea caraganae]
MAVIPFAPRRRLVDRAAPDGAQQQAEILFFTGVRYERAPEALPAAKPARRTARISPRSKPIAKSAGQPA